LTFVALEVILAGSCKEASNTVSPPKRASRLEFDTIGWTMESDGDEAISEAAFDQAIKAAFRKVTLHRLEARRTSLTGEMAVSESRGALALEVRIDTAEIPFPLTMTLAADADINGAQRLDALMRRGLADLASATQEMVRVAEGGEREWTSALSSAEPDIQILGARLLGVNRVKKAIAPVAALLTDPRDAVAEAAADALKRIGDKKAVPLLIRSIRRGDIRSEVRVIEAIGNIGGAEAEAYLEMTAIGHELAEVRRISKELLAGLRKEKKRP
jgi:hypothetical protein